MIFKNIAEYEDTDSELAKFTISKLHSEIERLTDESTEWESKYYEEVKKVDKATEYIEYNDYCDAGELLEILKGE